MTEFVAYDLQAEVSDTLIDLVVSASKARGADLRALQERHDLADLHTNKWHNQQKFLNWLKEGCDLGLINLITIGTQIPQLMNCLPATLSVEQAFRRMIMVYQECHRRGNVGCCEGISISARRVHLIASTPYPSELEYGLCWGISRRFAPPNGQPQVQLIYTDISSPVVNEHCRAYAITW